MTIFQKSLILIILSTGFLLRTYKINNPVADWHSHRQADTASVTRIFSQSGINLFVPRYHDLSNVQSGKENPSGYRMVELPLYNAISVYFHQIIGTNLELSSRLVSIFFSLCSGLLIFLICYSQTRLYLPSLFALIIFMILPFNIFYSRTILPEPAAVFFMLLTLYLFPLNLFFSSISFAIALLLKPFTGLILFPILFTQIIIHQTKYLNIKSFLKLTFFSAITLIPFFSWRLWISRFPEGIPQSDWLLNNGITTTFPAWYHGYNLSFLNKLIALRPHWWEWLFNERINNLILGGYGLIPLFLGFVYKKNHTQKFSFSLLLGILLYFIVIAQGNIQHDYYQVLIIPFLSILCGFGYYYIYSFTFKSHPVTIITIFSLLTLGLYFSWTKVKGYYQIDRPAIVVAGQKARGLLLKNSLVIAPYNGDTALLYQTGFRGWPTEIYDIPTQIIEHKEVPIYLVSVNYDNYTNKLIETYPTLFRNNDFIILKLSP